MKTLLYIGNKLSKHGYTPTSIETLGAFFNQEGYKMYYASEKRNQIFRFLDMGLSVIKQRNKVDYVIIDTYSTLNFWYAVLCSSLCRLLNIRYIPILRGGDLPRLLDKSPWLCRQVFCHAYKNVAPSRYLQEAFNKKGYSNLVYIPNTIDQKQYIFRPERDYTMPKLLWVRSFASLYNPKMAVDVLVLLRRKYPEASLTMVGPDKDGSLEETRRYAQEQGVSVTFTGRLSKLEWTQLSESHNIFINTTNFDNTPVSVIEALCLGLPVVTTNVGGIPYLLEDQKTALFVQAESSEQMAASVDTLIQNPVLCQELVNRGKALVDIFDWEQCKVLWQQLFEG